MVLTRRGFLQIASAAIATPVIAHAALTRIIVPGISEVEAVTRGQILSGNARYANAIFTPGQVALAAVLIHQQASLRLPHGTRCEIRAVPLTADQMSAESRHIYRRNGYAVLWVADAGIQSGTWDRETDFYRVGTFVTGDPVPSGAGAYRNCYYTEYA